MFNVPESNLKKASFKLLIDVWATDACLKVTDAWLWLTILTSLTLISPCCAVLREDFKNKNDETYGIFHLLVDPPPLPTYGKFFRDFLLYKKDF